MSFYETAPFLTNVHRFLDKAQAVPLVGPVLASPVKTIVSIAQIVIAIAATVFLRVLLSFRQNRTLIQLSLKQSFQILQGIEGLISSTINMITLGYAGYKNEHRLESLSSFNIMSLTGL